MSARAEIDRNPTVAIVGAGALGGYFGVRLALAGYRVRFLMRSDLPVVRQSGLRLELEDGSVHKVARPEAFASTAEIGPADIVIIALKTTQNSFLQMAVAPLLREGTVLLTLQNGLGNAELLRELFPGHPVLAGLCQIGVNRVAPGIIRNFIPGGGFVQLAAVDSADADRVAPLAAILEQSHIQTKIVPSLGEAAWRKLMWNVPFNGLTILAGGVSTDYVMSSPSLRAYARELMEELRAAASQLGYTVESDYTEKLLDFTERMQPYRPSSLIDFLEGKELEVEAIFGEPLRRGEAVGVDMPRLRSMYLLLQGVQRRKPPAC